MILHRILIGSLRVICVCLDWPDDIAFKNCSCKWHPNCLFVCLFLPFSRSGLLTPEPDENLLNSTFSPGEAAQGCSSLLPQMIGGKQSRVEQPFAVGATMARVPTPRPSDAGVIMVKPYQGEGNAFLVTAHPTLACI